MILSFLIAAIDSIIHCAFLRADSQIYYQKEDVGMLPTVKQTLMDSFNLRMDLASPEEIAQNIEAGAKVKGTNMCILMLAILIASIGLNMNSTAVIIGAMLISPLMGGIQAIGYGISVNDLNASKRAAVGLCFQVIICILTSYIYFSLSPISQAHSEILARTSPSLWDVLIAICGGLAGIIGVTRKEKSNVIPGVAIATALMPPLCTAGFGLATRNFKFFLGAMYLFFINSFFICLSAIVILKIIRLPCKEFIDEKAKHKLYMKITAIAVITVIPSIILAVQLISNTIENSNIEKFIRGEFDSPETQIVQMHTDLENNQLEIALLGRQLPEYEIQRLNRVLPEYGLADYSLKIAQPNMEGVVTADDLQKYFAASKADDKIALTLKDNEISSLQAQLKEKDAALQAYESHSYDWEAIQQELQILYPEIQQFSMGRQHTCATDGSPARETLLVVLTTEDELTDQQLSSLKQWFTLKTGETSVSLIQTHPEPAEQPLSN